MTCPNTFSVSRVQTRKTGFSLIELNMVVATIAIVALLVAPARAPAESGQADRAATQLENALRFARDKTSQTQVRHGLRLGAAGRTVRLFRIDPATDTAQFDVYHPMTKALYSIDLGADTRAEFLWAGTGELTAPVSVWRDGVALCAETNALMFDATGSANCYDPFGARLQNVAVRVGTKRTQVNLEVDPYSGRVTRR